MKILPTCFRENKFLHLQLQREGSYAIFRRQRENASRFHFEVIVIDSHNGYTIAGNYCPPAEMYPNAKQWGNKGWTFTDETEARAKFNSLCGNVGLDDPAFL